MKALLLPLLMVLMLAGCARPLDRTEVPGTYEFAFDGLKQVVTVSSDAQYTNSLYENGVQAWSDRHEWTYEQQAGRYGITFSSFRFGVPGHSPQPGFWFVVPTRTLGGSKQLCFDADLGRCFRSSG